MKATRKFGMWKAIAFLTIVISCFSCCPDPGDELLSQAVVTAQSAENVTTTTATLVATVTPNQINTSVSYYYAAFGAGWTKMISKGTFEGNQPIRDTLNITGLTPGTLYRVMVTAFNEAGSVTSSVVNFTTIGLSKPVVVIGQAENVKISTAKLTASVNPNQSSTNVTFEYQTGNSVWKSQSLPVISGTGTDTDLVKLTLDLSDLQAATSYNFRVKAVNKDGESVSEIRSFTTYAVADYDGNLYHTVKIGNQIWLQESFKGTHFANGDEIPNVKDQTTWDAMTTPAYCWYNNDAKIGSVYGGLYNFYAFNDPRGLLVGFHSPSLEEWNNLADCLGGSSVAGGEMKEAGYSHWIEPNAGATNSSGFTGLPSGGRQETFGHLGDGVMFWSTTRFPNSNDFILCPDLGEIWAFLRSNQGLYLRNGLSIRLLKN